MPSQEARVSDNIILAVLEPLITTRRSGSRWSILLRRLGIMGPITRKNTCEERGHYIGAHNCFTTIASRAPPVGQSDQTHGGECSLQDTIMLQASSTSPVLVEALCGGTEITTRGTPIANQPFYPVNSCRPRPFLSFARFDNDPELLSSIQDLNIPVLKNAVWRLNNDGELCGGFSYIERASWNNQDVAVKFLRGAQTVSGQNRGERSFHRELIAWRHLKHPNILPFLGVVCVDNKYLGMVSPYMPNGSAPKYIAKNPDANVLQILYDVAIGLGHLSAHHPPIAHGDLKGANVLIDQDGRARICDFGLSKFMKDFLSIDTRCGGTTRWMAPEQLLSPTMMVSLSADIFSWGMLSLELISGSAPWPEVQQEAVVVINVAIRNQRPDRPTCTQQCQMQTECGCLIGDDALWELIQQCWLRDPNERPTATELCEALAQNPALHP